MSKITPKKLLAFILAGFAVILGILVYAAYEEKRNQAPPLPALSKEQQQRINEGLARMQENQRAAQLAAGREQQCSPNAASFLESLKRGDGSTAGAFWKPGVTTKTLFAVQSYREIGWGPYPPAKSKGKTINRTFGQFEVESSTRGGFPIRKRWDIVMEPSAVNYADIPCAIVDLIGGE